MSLHAVKLLLTLIAASCGIVLVAVLVWNRRRLNRMLELGKHLDEFRGHVEKVGKAAEGLSALDIEGARQQLDVAMTSNDLDHQAQNRKLESIEGRVKWMQHETLREKLEEIKKTHQEKTDVPPSEPR